MRDFSQPKEFEDDDGADAVNTRELYCANGLRITYSDFLNRVFILKTDLYSIIVMEKVFGRGTHLWAISIIESESKFFTALCEDLPEFMQAFNGDVVKNFTSAEEVNYLVKKLLGLKVFL